MEITLENRLEGFLGRISTLGNYVKSHSKEIGRAAVLTTALIAGMYTAGCNGNNSDPVEDAGPDGDTDSDTDSDSDTDTDSDTDIQVDPIDESTVFPDEGSIYTPANSEVLPQFDSPEGDYSDEEGTITADGDDWNTEVASENVNPSTTIDGVLDLLTAKNGNPVEGGEEIDLTFALGGEEVVRTIKTEGYFGGEKPAIERCSVINLAIGAGLGIMCYGDGPSGLGSLTGGWTLTSDLTGAYIQDELSPGSSIIGGVVLDGTHVGIRTYTVTASDGTNTSNEFAMALPVDIHKSYVIIHCQETGDEDMYLPETSVNAVATTCGTGYNPDNKPDSLSDPDYELAVDISCVQGAIDALTQEEKDAHRHYNQGVTIDDVYADSECTVDSVMVKYNSSL